MQRSQSVTLAVLTLGKERAGFKAVRPPYGGLWRYVEPVPLAVLSQTREGI